MQPGFVFVLCRRLKAAQEYQQQALTLRQKLAPGSLDVAMSLAYLADTAHDQGDLRRQRTMICRRWRSSRKWLQTELKWRGPRTGWDILSPIAATWQARRSGLREALAIQQKL